MVGVDSVLTACGARWSAYVGIGARSYHAQLFLQHCVDEMRNLYGEETETKRLAVKAEIVCQVGQQGSCRRTRQTKSSTYGYVSHGCQSQRSRAVVQKSAHMQLMNEGVCDTLLDRLLLSLVHTSRVMHRLACSHVYIIMRSWHRHCHGFVARPTPPPPKPIDQVLVCRACCHEPVFRTSISVSRDLSILLPCDVHQKR